MTELGQFRIWIDADAAPRDVREIVFRAARRLEIETVMVANQRVRPPADNPFVSFEWVRHGPDEADRFIVEHSEGGDLAVTADIPLAAELVDKGVHVLDPRGEEYSEANIRERLSVRDFLSDLRDSGVETGGPRAFGEREKREFAGALDRYLTRTLRRRKRG
ncbi:MAG: YaiI/YqxD family protein [Gemmatimonadales bacterium]|nr:MAG: YaiI/YqxD family protein [Gemmatimonadales bacterium]